MRILTLTCDGKRHDKLYFDEKWNYIFQHKVKIKAKTHRPTVCMWIPHCGTDARKTIWLWIFFARSSSIQFVISFGWYNQIEYNFKLLTKWLFLFQINLSNSFSVSYEIEYLISTNFSPVQWNLLFFFIINTVFGGHKQLCHNFF